MELKICHLYPDVLNLYGDTGNIICIVYRDIGMVDSDMEKGEQPVHMATLPQNIDEVVKMLA